MSRRKRKYSPEETIKYERRYKRQLFKQPDDNSRYEWVDMTFYMLDHQQFKKLSVYSTKLYLYMRQWAYKSISYVLWF